MELEFADGKKMQISEEAGVVMAAHIAQELVYDKTQMNSFDQRDE